MVKNVKDLPFSVAQKISEEDSIVWLKESNKYLVLNSNQIKLADGTNTTFDSNNPDIRYSGGGETPYVSDDFQIGYDGAYEHLIAPNGKLSNLTPEQYALVRTPAFKKWFGDWENDPANASKVVDENGEPLVVYHGTDVEFNVFDKNYIGSKTYLTSLNGFHFVKDKTIANRYGFKIKSFCVEYCVVIDQKYNNIFISFLNNTL